MWDQITEVDRGFLEARCLGVLPVPLYICFVPLSLLLAVSAGLYAHLWNKTPIIPNNSLAIIVCHFVLPESIFV